METKAAPARMPLKHIIAVAAGNALSFYDFLCYAFFAVQIGRTFFPDPSSSLLLSFATFGVGFLLRPIGALIIGRYADRVGRRPAMMVSFALMGVAIAGLALTPPYAIIGVAAPILVVFFRLLQGFALGGELGPTTAYLLEAAPRGRRGFYTSLSFASQDFASFLAAIVGFTLASLLSDAALDAWGWRLAFLLGVTVVPLGLIIRRTLPETLHAPDDDDHTAAATSRGPYMRVVVLTFVMLAAATMAGYAQTNITAYATASLHLATQVAFAMAACNTFLMALFDPVGGWLADKFGRKPVMIVGTALLLSATLPAFYVMSTYRDPILLCVASSMLGMLSGIAQPPIIIAATEALPRQVRAGTIAVVYALAISVFGGMTPFAITWLVQTSGNPLSPAWYMIAGGVFGLTAMVLTRETWPVALRRGEGSRAGALPQ